VKDVLNMLQRAVQVYAGLNNKAMHVLLVYKAGSMRYAPVIVVQSIRDEFCSLQAILDGKLTCSQLVQAYIQVNSDGHTAICT
jgi:hypothetical protein